MKVLVVGSGAREHALARSCAKTADVVVAPGREAMASRLDNGHTITTSQAHPEEIEADLVVIGPEAPLVEGLADRLRAKGRAVLGPGHDGARLEGSKAFMKEVCVAANVPTAAFAVFERADEAIEHLRRTKAPYVIKTDGLAAGKGVLVTDDLVAAERDVEEKLGGSAFGDAGKRIVIEEAMSGRELTLLALCDGRRVLPLPLSRDYKRVGDEDSGPNTGGMGALSPVPSVPEALVDEAMARIVEPTIAELSRRGVEYRGVLYAGLMLTDEGVKLVEFNVRLGDPEAEVVLARIGDDPGELFLAAAQGHLGERVSFLDVAAVCVVLASAGYPVAPKTGDPIVGLDAAEQVEGVSVLHAGTSRDRDGVVRTAGGRVLAVTGCASSLGEARDRAYEAVAKISFDGAIHRRDIAADPGVTESATR